MYSRARPTRTLEWAYILP